MAITTVKSTHALDEGWILTPERYHPGRRMSIKQSAQGVVLGDLIDVSSKAISAKALEKHPQQVYVLDTGDAIEGRIRGDKELASSLNSQKKLLQPGDVIISRLRPYLRQVGFVDRQLVEKFQTDTLFACSTEFYVLRPKKAGDPLAFLVPYLLSEPIQTIFANAVEGSQHPRFNEDVLLSLLVPETIVEERDHLSQLVTTAISSYRVYEHTMQANINMMNRSMNKMLL
ncbi:hypothetical protein FHS18_005312 [Paenibacillus phyllosphaerae]|uniref:Type I restriction modification DNA specificity domain-containing protein n=1 Tax=Paenibacillus phyllosphaerae TaxID=274593 RepID=A0A7W5B2F5_9BACL|nr:hypothetical protein [Paenibacillus phyllosphaerae]MBB3113209.1 hypothetical protein [Paenibacillus phyllosphaerae]